MNSRPKTGAMKMNTHFPKFVALTIGTWAFVAFFVVFGTIINASAATFGEDEGGQMFTHNGSLMRMVTLPYGRGIEIRYEEPRPGLQDVGVRQGTLLFRGNWRGNTLVGQALVFPNGCRSVPYEVKGYVGRYGEIVLEGMAPVVQPYSCVFVGWERNRNSYLRFDPAA